MLYMEINCPNDILNKIISFCMSVIVQYSDDTIWHHSDHAMKFMS